MDRYEHYTLTITKFVQELVKDPNIVGCFVLGSYARKELGRFSDVDLYIVVKNKSGKETNWLLFDEIYFSLNYYTEESLRQLITFTPKTFIEFSSTFDHVTVIHDKNNLITDIIKKAKDNTLQITTNEELFKKTISNEFSAMSEEICKVANAVERGDEIDFNMVSFFSVIGILNCLHMANKTQLRTDNTYLHQGFEMANKPAHFDEDVKVLLRFKPSTVTDKIQSIIRFYNESFVLLKNLQYLTNKAIYECTFLQKNVLAYLQSYIEV